MNKTTKLMLCIAALLVVGGLVMFTVLMSSNNFDFGSLSTVKFETNTININDDFDKILIRDNWARVQFKQSDTSKCKIECDELEKVKHIVTVNNGTLEIKTQDTRKWFDYIGIFTVNQPELTVYLPEKEYASLMINTNTGDISLPGGFTFENVKIDSDTSDVDIKSKVTGTLEIELSTGDINIKNTQIGNLKTEVSTGDIRLETVKVLKTIEIETDTGDVTFKDSDASEIYVETDTGDVRGTLLTDKIFITETDTGSIRVPKSTTGGKCEIKTDTGNIKIEIK